MDVIYESQKSLVGWVFLSDLLLSYTSEITLVSSVNATTKLLIHWNSQY